VLVLQFQIMRSWVQVRELLPEYVIFRFASALGTPLKTPYHDEVRVPVVLEFTA